MPQRKIKLFYPSESTLTRLQEIHFYMFVNTFAGSYNPSHPIIDELFTDLFRLFNSKQGIMTTLIQQIQTPGIAPTQMEKAIAIYYLNALSDETPTVRVLQNHIGLGNGTYYAELTKYIEQDQPDLEPKLTEQQLVEVKKFMSKAKRMFKDISDSVKGVEIYNDEY